ncbi:MAG: PHP domain-containing protein [Longimicrobiales bacterium]
MKLDLHIHSNASDGSVSPEEVVERALEGGLDVIALADHDTTAGVARAAAAAANHPIEIIPALELSSTLDGAEIHILGYFVDAEAPCIEAHRQRSRDARENRMRGMLDRLALQGVRVKYDDVTVHLGAKEVAPARPHLARALVAAGHAVSVPDAFARLIGDDSPAFLATDIATPAEVIEVVRAAGGISSWAHPEKDRVDTLLEGFVSQGLAGLEIYRPFTRQAYVEHLEGLASQYDLLKTGGSDWHGPEGKRELGQFFVEGDEIAAFLAAGGL